VAMSLLRCAKRPKSSRCERCRKTQPELYKNILFYHYTSYFRIYSPVLSNATENSPRESASKRAKASSPVDEVSWCLVPSVLPPEFSRPSMTA
jgi:hypothetical protein